MRAGMDGVTRDVLLALLQCGLAESGRSDKVRGFAPFFGSLPAAPDWRAVYRASVRQGVLAITWDGLQRLIDEDAVPESMRPDSALALQWVCNVEAVEARYAKQKRVLASLAKFYGSHGIRMMLLKGYGLSLHYPVPEHRPCGDIDIWLYGERERADRLLHEERGVTINEDTHHHTIFFVEGVMIENHYDFLNVHSHRANARLEQVLQQLCREGSREIEVEGERVFLPPSDFNALFLLRHAAGHYAAINIGLRHVADWALFVRDCGSEVDWGMVERMAREYDMHRFLCCLNAIAARCSGVDAELFPQFGHDELEERVFNDILEPEFDEPKPERGFVRINGYRLRRWLANRWKFRLVYSGSLVQKFAVQLWSHLLKPKSFR